VPSAAAHVCYNPPQEVWLDYLKLLLNVGMGTGMISLSGALIALAVFVAPPFLIGVATFALLLRD